MSIDRNFADELYKVCKKYKKNVVVKYDDNEKTYEIDIHGAWDINEYSNCVEVYEYALPELVYEVKGGRKVDIEGCDESSYADAVKTKEHEHIWIKKDGTYCFEDEANLLSGSYESFDCALNAYTNYVKSLGK